MNGMDGVLKTVSLKSPTLGMDVVHALLTDGFFLLSDHEVPLAELLDAGKRFFGDADAKRSIPISHFRGYSGLGAEVTKYDGVRKRDWHEGYDYVPETDDPQWRGINQFPSPEFKELIEGYIERCNAVGFRVVRAIEAALQLPEGRIVNGEPFSLLRLLHYPPVGKGESAINTELDVGLGIGEHTDYGFLTFVHSDVEGLQVRSRIDNEWLAVPVGHGCLVVNIGDSLSNMTSGVLRATPHRVTVNSERSSVAFFFEPPLNQIVEPIRNCSFIDQHPKKKQPGPEDAPFRYGNFLFGKYAQSFPSLETK